MLRRELGPMHKMLRGHWLGPGHAALPETKEKPWIGAVDTFAIGGGLQLLLGLDHVLATRGTYFRLPALTEGIVPGSANLRLARLVGARHARRMIFDDEPVPVDGPDGRVLCDRVVPEGAMDTQLAECADRLANPAVVANRRMLLMTDESPAAYRRYLAQYAWEQAQPLYSTAMVRNLERTWINRRRSAQPAA
jgi:thioesterase DpgC